MSRCWAIGLIPVLLASAVVDAWRFHVLDNPWIFVFLLGVLCGSIVTMLGLISLARIWRIEWRRRVDSLPRHIVRITDPAFEGLDVGISPVVVLVQHPQGNLIRVEDVEKLAD